MKDSSINYTWFDFHGECKKMKWENLSKLVNICKEEMESYGHFICELKHGFNFRDKFNSSSNAKVI